MNVSLEAIEHQYNHPYPKQVEALFQLCIDAKGKVTLIDHYLHDIAALTLKTVGIILSPELCKATFLQGGYAVSMVTDDITAISPLNQRAVAAMQKGDFTTFKVDQILTGTIDLKNAKVSGFFSTLKNKFLVSPSIFDGSLTAAELTALYGHELGHAFTIYEYLGQSLVTNAILAEVMKLTTQVDLPIKRRFELGKAAVDLSGYKGKVPDDVDTAAITAMILKGQDVRMAAAVGSRWYDKRLAEALADQFAARWGMGANLVTAMGKLYKARGILGPAGYTPKWLGIGCNILNIALLPFTSVTRGVAAVVVDTVYNVAKSMMISGTLASINFIIGEGKYDDPRNRYLAIRRESVSALKDRDLPDDVRRQILADIAMIDGEINNIHGYDDVMGYLAKYLIGLFTGRGDELKENALSEDLVNNRLYELAATLKG